MKKNMIYIDYTPGVWYGSEFDPPMHCDLVVEIRHDVHNGLQILRLASYSQVGWLIRDFGDTSMKDWKIMRWLMLPKVEED